MGQTTRRRIPARAVPGLPVANAATLLDILAQQQAATSPRLPADARGGMLPASTMDEELVAPPPVPPPNANQLVLDYLVKPGASAVASLFGALDAPPSRYPAGVPYASPLRVVGAANAVLPAAIGLVVDAITGQRPALPTVNPMAPAEAQATFAGEAERRDLPSAVQFGGTLADLLIGPEHGLQGVAAMAPVLAGAGLYSRLERAAAALPAKGLKAESVLNALKRAPEGVSAEELAWRLVPEFLESRKGQVVTPADLQAHLDAHPLNVQAATAQGDSAGQPRYAQYTLPGGRDYRETVVRLKDAPHNDYEALLRTLEAKYGQGFSREVLTAAEQDALTAAWNAINSAPGGYGSRVFRSSHFSEPNIVVHTRSNTRTLPAADLRPLDEIERQILSVVPGARSAASLASGAPDRAVRQGVITEAEAQAYSAAQGYYNGPGGTRSVMPTGPEGRFVEEVQSDWHQAGKGKGYQLPPLREADIETRFVTPDVPDGHDPSLYPGYWEAYDKRTGALITRGGGQSERSIREEALSLGPRQSGAVPDAPFKETWPDLGLKQQLLEAARDPKAAWLGVTSGDTQTNRYDLRQHIDELQYDPELGALRGWAGNEIALSQYGVTPAMLPEYVGHETAALLLAQPRTPRTAGALPTVRQNIHGDGQWYHVADSGEWGTQGFPTEAEARAALPPAPEPVPGPHLLRDADLSTGGEGMRAFYDQRVPKRLEKLVKPFGGRVERLPVSAGGTKTEPAWVVRLTPEMKRAMLAKGFPLLSLGALLAATPDDAQPGAVR